MDYDHTLTIPANTAEADAIEEILECCHGTVRAVFILVPPGHAGLAHLQIYRQTHQVWPTTIGQSFVGDDTIYHFEDNFPIHEAPYQVTLRGWNDDDTHEHSFYVKLIMPPPAFLVPVVMVPPTLPEGV